MYSNRFTEKKSFEDSLLSMTRNTKTIMNQLQTEQQDTLELEYKINQKFHPLIFQYLQES